MAFQIEITQRAEAGLASIYRFIDAEDSDAAFEWFRGLMSTIRSLSNLPHRGMALTDSRRYILYGNKPHRYKIIYTINDKEHRVRILYVRHGARHSST